MRPTVIAVNATVNVGLSAAFAREPAPLRVTVECYARADRCGAVTPEEACALGQRIAAALRLRFQGLMPYPPVDGDAAVQAFLIRAIALLADRSIAVEFVSSGGTASMAQAGDHSLHGWLGCDVQMKGWPLRLLTGHLAAVDGAGSYAPGCLMRIGGQLEIWRRPDVCSAQAERVLSDRIEGVRYTKANGQVMKYDLVRRKKRVCDSDGRGSIKAMMIVAPDQDFGEILRIPERKSIIWHRGYQWKWAEDHKHMRAYDDVAAHFLSDQEVGQTHKIVTSGNHTASPRSAHPSLRSQDRPAR